MYDQVSELRHIASQIKPERKMRVIAVTSGKGGVGKTTFTVNLALALAEYGQRVIVLDGDMSLANVDIMFGMSAKYTIEHLLSGEKTIEQILLPGPQGVSIVPGGAGVQGLAELERDKLSHVIVNMGRLEDMADLLLIDTGAGLGYTVINLLKAADDVIIMITPEPTSLTDAYGLLKTLLQKTDEVTIYVVVNRVKNEDDAHLVFGRLETAARKFLDCTLKLMGWIYDDPLVGRSIIKQEPLGVSFPESPSYRCIQWVAGTVMGIESNPPRLARGILGFLNRLLPN